MENAVSLNVNFKETIGKIKPMHATNNGPAGGREVSNSLYFKQAGIPYARNHDASFCAGYGGNHTVDVNFIFTDFDADENDEKSYDFILTDKYIKDTEECGVRTFYRLGTKIEHEIKKYNTNMPKDFKKWARICEHIIRHYTEGWANGFRYDIEYWEIWNEYECGGPNGTKLCWQGTNEQFYEFYETSANYLKACFPKLKIGGPALTGVWAGGTEPENFLKYMSERRVPIDFFSYHCYTTDPRTFPDCAKRADALLKKYGYENAENILNEWNYICGWAGDAIKKSYKVIKSPKGAAFISAAMIAAQKSPMDMFMYYDARPQTTFNGMFEDGTYEPLSGYYSFVSFNELYKLENEVKTSSDDGDVYICAAKKDKNAVISLVYYSDSENVADKTLKLDLSGLFAKNLKVTYILNDENHSFKTVKQEYINGERAILYILMHQNSALTLKLEEAE